MNRRSTRAVAGRTAEPLGEAAVAPASPKQSSRVRPAPYSKYRAKAVVVDGERFASKAEAKRHQELLILQRADAIYNLRRQPRYPLLVHGELICTYVGDWEYEETGGLVVVEDKKGFQTPEFKLKAKLFRALYPHIELRLT